MKLRVIYRDGVGEIKFDELLNSGTLYIGDVPSSFMDNLMVYCREYTDSLFVHDYTGRYRGLGAVYLDIGGDLKLDMFSEPELFLYSLKASLKYMGIRAPYWELVMPHIIYSFRESDGDGLDSFINFLVYRANESSGLERMSYITLHNILLNIFTGDIFNLFSYNEYSEVKDLSKPIFIGYDVIDNFLARSFIQLFTSLYLAKRYPNSHHIIMFSDALDYIPRNILHSIFNVSGFLIHSTGFYNVISTLTRYIIIHAWKYIDKHFIDRYIVPSDYLGSDYLLLDKNVILALETPNVSLGDQQVKRSVELGDNYISIHKAAIKRVLEIVNRYGELSIDGVYVNLGDYDLPYIASLIDRLWRDGYLRRISGRGRVRYRLTIKGIRLLRGGDLG